MFDRPEAEFLDENPTKSLFLLAQSQLYKYAFIFLLLQTHAASDSF
jgi:hypothetical protein